MVVLGGWTLYVLVDKVEAIEIIREDVVLIGFFVTKLIVCSRHKRIALSYALNMFG